MHRWTGLITQSVGGLPLPSPASFSPSRFLFLLFFCCPFRPNFLSTFPVSSSALLRLLRDFHSLVPLIDCIISDDLAPSTTAGGGGGGAGLDKGRCVFSHLTRLILGGLVKPLQALGQILDLGSSSSSAASRRSSASSSSSSSSSCSSSKVSHHSPTEVLKNFKEIRRLRIELPTGELAVDDGILLKWKADFGSTLDSCIILGASSVLSSSSSLSPKSSNPNPNPSFQDACGGDDSGSIPESFYNNGTLKLRVVWTISSLIAASACHYLLQPIIADHETLESLDLTDTDGKKS